ncbi:Glycosyltransferase involved in cell wall bisynthesis [Roseomonas rosea]|uniref:Glycosyltransferase involved in cell wall bisynthesis n=1 Tax=Muricoccus roseus TaxID=198092 RepID=A0A1M6S4A9_9PROT|nr:glycosyltransferase [Roseomonas rosea]SHK39555.1 Glycosyltransferase involved in cell wall bisynthesis [Roseomonas rosea]
MAFVNIVTSDRGWILEKLAREITDRLPYVTFGGGPDPSAAIQYYVTYSCRTKRLSPVEVGYFAHLEPEGEARERFFETARAVEHCICHARLYEGVLREAGVENVTTISPGVDLETFSPKLRIGVVGRTYHTGRKGEHIVSQVMDIPEIEWSFTGSGWPGEALELPGAQLPDYYRSLDYVLVPALYEGGPMCVVEALACGTEIIAPAIGWVPEFPHVEYRVGDAADLRRVLLELVEKKRALRATVLDRTWDGWAEGHDRVFRALAKQHGLKLSKPSGEPRTAPQPQRVGVFMHGNENRSQGGPSVRVPRLARELRENGTDAELRIHPAPRRFEDVDVVHAFNSWSPWSALDLLRRAHRAEKAVVFSPILLNLALKDLWEGRLVQLLSTTQPGPALDAALEEFKRTLDERRLPGAPIAETVPGFHAAVQEMIALSDHVVLLSERERDRLARIGAAPRAGTVVHNPVDTTVFGQADPALFEQETGLKDFVLCVARIESRKNQVMLAHALRDTGVPLVLVGHAPNAAYRELLERYRTANIHVLERLPPNSPLLASAFAASRVAVLPSWAEGAPLAALEAAASGASLVVSDESGESEYFGERARYCDPGDPASIRGAIMEAYETRRDAAEIEAQKAFIAETYSWDRHRERTQAVYAEALSALAQRAPYALAPRARKAELAPPPAPAIPADRPVTIVYDVTSSANHTGRWTGIARVEAALALTLKANPRTRILFVAWNNKAKQFVEVPFEGIRAGKLARFLAHYDTNPAPLLRVPQGAHFVVPGSGWMQNALYAENVVAFARRHALRLTPVIHDIIPTKFPFWFNDGYAPLFEQNLTMLLDGAAHVIAISQATRRDVEEYAARVMGLFIPEVSVFREGDEIQQIATGEDGAARARIEQQLGSRPFVLTVGAIHQRKNHKLLYDVWLKLHERMGGRCPRLVIVGGVAWNGHDVARALRGDARLRDVVTILEGVDDEALDWLYRNSIFTVYPSLYEGWGLPVAESLRYGKLCLAADTSSVPEIAPGLVELIDPLDVTRWVTKVQFYAGSRAAREMAERRIADGYAGFSWEQSAEHFLDVLAAAESRPSLAKPYILGTVVNFADRIAASRLRGSGWHPLEKWGCWASGSSSTLLFSPAVPAEGPLVFVAEARALALPNTAFEARILANGVPVARWLLRGSGLQTLHAIVPADVARLAPGVTIEIESAFLTPLRLVTKSDDPRLVGIGISKVSLASLAHLRSVAGLFGEPPADRKRAELGHSYNLLRDPTGRTFLDGNWTAHPAWGLYSAEQRPRLSMALQDRPGEDLVLDLRLRPVATRKSGFTLLAIANGMEIGAAGFEDDEPRLVSFPIPAAIRAMAEPVVIDLVASDALSPQALGLGTTEEAFSFGIISLELRAAGEGHDDPRLPVARGEALRLGAGTGTSTDELVRAALGGDWHGPERVASWSFGRSGTIPLRVQGSLQDGVLLTLEVEAARPASGAPEVRLEVSAGDRPLATHRLPPLLPRSIDVAVPPDRIGPRGELDLRLTVDSLGAAPGGDGRADERPMGIRVGRIRNAALPVMARDKVVVFRAQPDTGTALPEAAEMLRGIWFGPERSGRWSQGDAGGLAFLPDPALGKDWRFFVLARSFMDETKSFAPVDIEISGEVTERWSFSSDRSAVMEVHGLAERHSGEGLASVFFRCQGSRSPAELGLGKDSRLLGMQLAAVLLTRAEVTEQEVRDAFAAALSRRDKPPEPPAPQPPPPLAKRPAEAAAPAPAPARPAVAPLPPPRAEPPREAAPAKASQPPPAEVALLERAEAKASVPVQSNLFDFSADGELEQVDLFGWYEAEAEGRWSRADLAEVMLPVPSDATGELRLEVFGRVYGTATGGPARVRVALEDGEPAELLFENDSFKKRSVTLRHDAAAQGTGQIRLSLIRQDPISPADAGEGDDTRRLGVLVRTLGVMWA